MVKLLAFAVVACGGLMSANQACGANTSCDFDGNTTCDVADLNMLYAELGQIDSDFNLDESAVVDDDDVTVWLRMKSENDNVEYRRGDTDFSGTVDVTDFEALQQNFGQTGGWSDGNFVPVAMPGGGTISGADFTALALNWDPVDTRPVLADGDTPILIAVPEPSGLLLAGLALAGMALRIRRR